ncbi:MAG: nitroreductase family protein [Candidatus Krumholzibacteria bacterium]|nr:nitroreductase family protein [Candidatus Krumholzibacteria bacterium]
MSADIIFRRRSIRRFAPGQIPEEALRTLLGAGMSAPSSNDRQPWEFVLVTERAHLDRLAEAHPHGKMLFEAAAAIAVCGLPGISPDYWVQDCSAATENILVAAAALGLGSVWLGCHPRQERVAAVREILGIPASIGVLSLVALGRPAEAKEPRDRYDEARVHRETW